MFTFLCLTSSSLRQLQFSPEEVLGMVLNYSRSLAEDFAGEPLGGAGSNGTSPGEPHGGAGGSGTSQNVRDYQTEPLIPY